MTEPFLQTFTGRKFHFRRPSPTEVHRLDIVKSLANKPRYNGHCDPAETVAEHSVLVSEALERDFPDQPLLWFKGLMHDAGEYILPDMPRPLKQLFQPTFGEIESAIMDEAIWPFFGLEPGEPAIVKEYDTRILSDERRQIMKHTSDSDEAWGCPLPPLGVRVEGWKAEEAFRRFWDRMVRLEKLARDHATGISTQIVDAIDRSAA